MSELSDSQVEEFQSRGWTVVPDVFDETEVAVLTEAALEVAARLAQRHLRDHRLPDSAVDVIDEAGAMLRLQAEDDASPQVDVPEVERVVARIARIPEKQASSSDRERLRTLEDSLKRVVFGQPLPVETVTKAVRRARAAARRRLAAEDARKLALQLSDRFIQVRRTLLSTIAPGVFALVATWWFIPAHSIHSHRC